MKGIYCYVDTTTDSVVYVGKDSYIDKSLRNKAHHYNCNRNKQKINQILQKNPNRYAYYELARANLTNDELNTLEIEYIEMHNPKFNFTKGGDGQLGNSSSQSTRKKISNALKGKPFSEAHKQKLKENHADFKGANHPLYGKHHSKETREKISQSKKGVPAKNKKDYIHIIKTGYYKEKQTYAIIRQGKRLKRSIHLLKLIEWASQEYPHEFISFN